MHIVDGVLSAPVLVGGGALAAAGVAIGLRRMDTDDLPRVGVLSAAFFVASLIHLPIGPTNAHLLLGGLTGLVLGWAAFPAILVALILQAVFFGFGGVTVLGVNLVVTALPAVAVGILAGPAVRRLELPAAAVAAGLAGAGAVVTSALLVALALGLGGESFRLAAELALVAHLPIAAVEGVVTAMAVVLLRRVRPGVLAAPLAIPGLGGAGRG